MFKKISVSRCDILGSVLAKKDIRPGFNPQAKYHQQKKKNVKKNTELLFSQTCLFKISNEDVVVLQVQYGV